MVSDLSKTRASPLLIATFLLAVAALYVSVSERSHTASPNAPSSLTLIQETKVLRIGYELYPPYTSEDPNTHAISGYSVDVANAIAGAVGWRSQWVRTGPDTKIADLHMGRFDMMVEPIFETPQRAKEVGFTEPYAYFGYAAAIVRQNDSRFVTPSDLNRPEIRVVVRQGYTDEAWAQQNIPRATLRSMTVDDISLVFSEVVTGQADVALADVAQVNEFARAHPGAGRALWTVTAPAYVPAGFMLRQGDFAFSNFLNVSLAYLRANGVLARLDAQYGVAERAGASSSLGAPRQ